MRMRAVYVLIFLLTVLGSLWAISVILPKEGIQVGDTTFSFRLTSIEELRSSSAQHEPPTPALPADSLTIADSVATDITDTIAIPEQPRYTCLKKFYCALDSLQGHSIRVVHYGDSQIEEDRITSVVRELLQERFGGGGIGLLPLYQQVPTRTMTQRTTPQPERHTVFGSKQMHLVDSKLYGPDAQVATIQAGETYLVEVSARQTKLKTRKHAHYFDRMVLYSSDSVSATIAGAKAPKIKSGVMKTTSWQLRDSTSRLSFSVEGKGDVYGFSLETDTGVIVDNIPMRGCAGTIFTRIDAAQLKQYFRTTRTRLIIMQFGGNVMPYLKTQDRADKYAENIRRQVRYLQQLAPDASILFVGPSDMTTNINGELQTYPILDGLDRKLQSVLEEEGETYWSMFRAMGGEGAMKRWVDSGLAASDYVHFMPSGADRIGRLLTEYILSEYDK